MSGVLIVLLPLATKLVEYLHALGKEYVGIAELHGDVSLEELLEATKQFTGDIYQRPPLRSSVSRRLRVRGVYRFEVPELKGRRFLFNVRTESGTYIRKLIHDLGVYLGVGAHMVELRRVSDGPFTEDSSFNLLEVAAAAYRHFECNDPALLRDVLRPMEEAVRDFPSVYVKDSAVAAICHGASLAVGGISKLDTPISEGEVVAIKSLKGELVAMGRSSMDSKTMLSSERGIAVTTERVIMEREIYPRRWR